MGETDPNGLIGAVEGITEEEIVAIRGGNAASLFGV
jgi:hypothetical protein